VVFCFAFCSAPTPPAFSSAKTTHPFCFCPNTPIPDVGFCRPINHGTRRSEVCVWGCPFVPKFASPRPLRFIIPVPQISCILILRPHGSGLMRHLVFTYPPSLTFLGSLFRRRPDSLRFLYSPPGPMTATFHPLSDPRSKCYWSIDSPPALPFTQISLSFPQSECLVFCSFPANPQATPTCQIMIFHLPSLVFPFPPPFDYYPQLSIIGPPATFMTPSCQAAHGNILVMSYLKRRCGVNQVTLYPPNLSAHTITVCCLITIWMPTF